MTPTEQSVTAALAFVDAMRGDQLIKPMTDAFSALRPHQKMGELAATAAARILAAEVRRLMELGK